MCGRAYQTMSEEDLELRYQWQRAKSPPLGLKLNYNLSPTQKSPVVFINQDKVDIQLMRWGLIPAWAKDIASASKYSLINARGEEIHEKRSYKSAFRKRRCIVPVSGFFEWKREGESTKRPFAIYLKSESIMSIAGIYVRWVSNESGEEVDSFSVVTTEANSFMEKIHNRMPVVLDQKSEEVWLDPNNDDVESLQKLLRPCPNDWLNAHEVSTMVNSPKNNRSENLEKIVLK